MHTKLQLTAYCKVCNGIQTMEIDMCMTNDKVDIIIVRQCYGALSNGCSSVKVVYDDTDTFVLLVFFYPQQNCKVSIFTEISQGTGAVVDITATVKKCPQIIRMLPVIHKLT